MVRRGDVRRAKLYYLRDLRGKASKIKERRGANNEFIVEETPVAKAAPVAAPVAEEVNAPVETPVETVVETPAEAVAEVTETPEA
jgi:hypothetical protein